MSYRYELYLRDSSIFAEAQHAETVSHILIDSGYEIDVDESGNIVGFYTEGSDICDDDELYQAFAPFLRSGSFLELSNEQGDTWRWVFFDGNCKRINPVMLWPKPDAPPGISRKIHEAFSQQLMPE